MARKNKAAAAMDEAKAYRVRVGRALLWPDGTHRGDAGYVVRADDPFLRNRHNLEPAPEGVEVPPPAPEGYPPRWASAYREQVLGAKPKDPRAEKLRALESRASDEEIEGPDEDPIAPPGVVDADDED